MCRACSHYIVSSSINTINILPLFENYFLIEVQDGRLLTPYSTAATNHLEKGRSEDPKRHRVL
jgi:hypothetical protein